MKSRTAGFVLTVIYPVLLVLIAVRIVMSPLFLQFEYNRPGFPEDYYGFTREDRLEYAPYALNYLINNEPISYLSDLTFRDGITPLYNERELQHMVDVQKVTQAAFLVAIGVGILALIIGGVFIRTPDTRENLRKSLRRGAVFTLAALFAIVLAAVFSWDTFFTLFHELFFTEGTWMFLYSDTLIRLFPEQFWFDAAITIGALAGSVALLTLIFTRKRERSLS